MHILQPKHTKLSEKEAEAVLQQFNLSKSQLPKIISTDPTLPQGSVIGDLIKIERKTELGVDTYFRVVV